MGENEIQSRDDNQVFCWDLFLSGKNKTDNKPVAVISHLELWKIYKEGFSSLSKKRTDRETIIRCQTVDKYAMNQ